MTQISYQTMPSAPAFQPLQWLAYGVAACAAMVVHQRRLAAHHAILSELSEAQLDDAGIARSSAYPSRPTIEVDAGLMNTLMTMR